MKKAMLIVCLLIFLIVLGITITQLISGKKNEFNLEKPKERIIKLDGKEYNFTITKYNPPYYHARLLNSKEEADCTTPEGTDLALWSSIGRDKDWYVSLFDEGAKASLFKRDKKANGRVLEEYLKNEPLPNPQETRDYSKFIYKVEFEHNGKYYTVIHLKDVFQGEEEIEPSYRSMVKQGKVWLVTEDLNDHPLEMMVGIKTYEEIVKESIN